MSHIVLVKVTGPDRPGITAAISAVASEFSAAVLDIGQAVIHDSLSLGILFHLPPQADVGLFEARVTAAAGERHLRTRIERISADDYERWVELQGQPRHIITLLSRGIGAEPLGQVAALVGKLGLNIDRITRLSGRIALKNSDAHAPASVEFSVRGSVDNLEAMHAQFLTLAQTANVDIAIQEDNLFRRNRRLVCFDMDSTLIQAEVIDELAAAAGVGDEVATITESAMRGEIDFSESFRRRLRLLKGMPEAVLDGIAERLPITEGAERLITTLKKCGYKVAILSGGFTYFANYLKQRLGIDYVYANELTFENGLLTGEVAGDIVDGARKAELLKQLAAQENLSLKQVIAVGDGANDLPMLSIAGLGIAYHAKPIVNEQARHIISNVGLDGILYFLGMRDRDIRDLHD